VGIDWTFASLDEAAAHTLYGFAGRAVAMAVSLGGVCVTALLLGIVSEQISHWIEDLKRGRSEVGVQQSWQSRRGRGAFFMVS
jgi:ion channel POLLUX/CASTOR